MWPIVSQFQGWAMPRQVSIPSAIASEGDLVAALELQHGAGLVRRRDLEGQLLDDLADAADLLGVALGQPPGADNGREPAGGQRASSVHETQREAIDRAREISRNQNSELFVHGRDGRIRERDSHGNDPNPPKG